MICISIAQESRRFALADMLNAAPQCDLLEVRLDRFGKSPEIGELLAAKPKPVILSCRRPQDGGAWDGSEPERLALLRQGIISKADYVEIELDAADQVRPFPPCKRVVSYTNLRETPADIGEVYAEAQKKSPDVVKLVTKAGTPEEAWPLVQILAKPAVPTVVVGLGNAELMLALLGKKMGAPWAYAALERGMEAHPGQPTVGDLRTVYHYPATGKATRQVAVTGRSERQRVVTALLNAAFAHLQLDTRCLPLEVGSMRLFRKVLEAVKLNSAVLDEEHRGAVVEIAGELQGAAAAVREADVIARQQDAWHGFHLLDRAAVAALEGRLREAVPSEKPLDGKTVLVVGSGPLAGAVARRLQKHGAILILSSRERDSVKALAQELQCRLIGFEAVYTTLHDALVVAKEDSPLVARAAARVRDQELRPSYLKPGMAVLDLTAGLRPSPLLREAAQRGCPAVRPTEVLLELVEQQVKLLTGKEVRREVLLDALAAVYQEEE
jgi:3-dehydroquinate dehydratase/shikimate dehydrogenase